MKRIRYYTNNSWNGSTSLAYNLKVYNVIPRKYLEKVYELMSIEGFYDEISSLIDDFGSKFDHKWQAGFNGRSGGYLVLYTGGRKQDHKSICTNCGQRNFTSVKETGKTCGKCGKETRKDAELYTVYTYPSKNVEDNEVPAEVKKAFRKLALDIVKTTVDMAKHAEIKTGTYGKEYRYIEY